MKETSPSDLLDNEIIELSFKDSEQSDEYPSLHSKDNINQSIFHDHSDLHQVTSIKKSSFNLEDSINDSYNQNSRLSQSFSALNSSIKDEPFKSKLKVIKNEQELSNQKNFWDLNKSIFTDRPSNPEFAFQRRSQEKYQQESFQQHHEAKPFQMQPNLPQIEVPKNSIKKQIALQNQIKLILRSTNYFLQKANGNSLLVNGEMLRDLYDEFFKKQLFIPLFKYEKYDEWYNSKDKFNIDLQSHRIFKISLQRYIQYINKQYSKPFDQIFKILEEIQRGKVSKKREQSSFSFLNFDFASIVESLKNYINSPKTQILRKTLLAKIRSIRETIKITETQTQMQKYTLTMKQKVEEEWNEFGEVELLLNFEQTEYYCTKKIENSPELKFRQIWIKYREFIRSEKTLHTQMNLSNILI